MIRHIHNRTKHFIDGVPAVWIAQEHGIKKNTYLCRLKKGWDLKKACTYKPMTAKEISLKTGLTINKIYSLKNQGYTWEELEEMANGKQI